jgi:hypothetical protein
VQVNSLRELVEDWYFEEGPFMEFVAAALQVLAGLLHSSGELETQLQVRCHGTSITLQLSSWKLWLDNGQLSSWHMTPCVPGKGKRMALQLCCYACRSSTCSISSLRGWGMM